MVGATDIVEGEVRELVRRRGLDPLLDTAKIRALIDDVLSDYEDRALNSALPPLGEIADLSRTVLDAVAGFGPLQRYLDDPTVEEIWINGPEKVFIARHGRSELTTTILSASEVGDLIERMLRLSGRRIDVSTPFVDAMLPDGSRLHAVIPDITRRHVALNIRKFVLNAHSISELVKFKSVTPLAARFLEAAVAAGLNIIVSGGTQTGKTTLLNCLCNAIPARERVITCEEVFELHLGLPDVVSMQTRQSNLEGCGEIGLRRLIKEALRMRPSRIVVGEVRQEECFDLLLALNSGLPGMGSVHANSAREAIDKLCLLPLLAGENVNHDFVVPTVGRTIDLVVHLEIMPNGHRQIAEIVSVNSGTDSQTIDINEIFQIDAQGLSLVDGCSVNLPRFSRQGIDIAAILGKG